MADQEPKRAFTPSGSYSMGLFESGDSVNVTADITGTSDFTFMMWVYPTTANQYIFKTSDNTAYLQIKSDGKLRFQILNTNLTNSVVESASAISLNTMQMITVTGNTTNGLKLYINDVLNKSSSMPANNNVAGKTWQLGTNYDGSLALFRSWSKELALADVEAHYAYDEDLLLQGGVAVSAMTTDQKTSLEFAIEMIQDVPYDSDEFDDRSTNKYAVTNNGVTLLGQSLQVYTDASDLPSAPQITPASFSGLLVWTNGENGYTDLSGNGVTVTNNNSTITLNELNNLDVFSFNGSQNFGYGTALGKPANFTVFTLVRTDDLGRNFICGSVASSGSSSTSWGDLVISQTGKPTGSVATTHSTGSSNTVTHSTDNLLSANTWHIVATTFTNGVVAQDIWIDGVKATVSATNAVTTNSGTVYNYRVGQIGDLASDQLTGDVAEHFVYDEVRSDAEIAQLTTYLQNRYGL